MHRYRRFIYTENGALQLIIIMIFIIIKIKSAVQGR